jgi:hypothetical protein
VRGGPARGEEHRPGLAAGGEPGQLPGGGGLEVQRPDMAALGAGPGLPVGQVEAGYVQAEGFLGAGGGVVQQPPQRPLPQRDVGPGPQAFQLGQRDRPGVVLGRGAAVGAQLQVPGGPAVAAAPGQERADGGQVPVPGARREAAPQPAGRAVQVLVAWVPQLSSALIGESGV